MSKTQRTFKELISHSLYWYGLSEQETRSILKAAGFEMFQAEKWIDYLNILREHWPHYKQIRMEQHEKIERETHLDCLYKMLRIVVTVGNTGWHYEGHQEVLNDILKRSEEARERNVRRFIQRMHFKGMELTPFSPKPKHQIRN